MSCDRTLHVPENCKGNMKKKVKANSHMSCRDPCRAVPWPLEFAFRTAWSEHSTGVAWAWAWAWHV